MNSFARVIHILGETASETCSAPTSSIRCICCALIVSCFGMAHSCNCHSSIVTFSPLLRNQFGVLVGTILDVIHEVLNAFASFGTGFVVRHDLLLGEFTCVFPLDSTLVYQIKFVADESGGDRLSGLAGDAPDITEPIADFYERLRVR